MSHWLPSDGLFGDLQLVANSLSVLTCKYPKALIEHLTFWHWRSQSAIELLRALSMDSDTSISLNGMPIFEGKVLPISAHQVGVECWEKKHTDNICLPPPASIA